MFTLFARQTLKQGLPRTLAPLGASTGFINGTTVGLVGGSLIAAFASDDPNSNTNNLIAGVAVTALGVGSASALASYGLTYGAANLALAAFPALKEKKLPLLVPGKKPQLLFFGAATAAQVAITGLGAVSNIKNNNFDRNPSGNNAPKM